MTKKINPFTLSERVNALAAEAGISLTALSEASGLGRGTIGGLLQSPDRTPHKSTIKKIARALNVDVRYLTGETDERSPFKEVEIQENKGLSQFPAFQEHSAGFQEKCAERGLAAYEVGTGSVAFGCPAMVLVGVNPQAAVRTGGVYLARLPERGLKIVYVAEPYLFWIESDGKPRHEINNSGIAVLGEVVETDT